MIDDEYSEMEHGVDFVQSFAEGCMGVWADVKEQP